MSQESLFSRTSIMLTGALITFGLFVFMSQLIKSDKIYIGTITEAPLLHISSDTPKPLPPKKIVQVIPQPQLEKPVRLTSPNAGDNDGNLAIEAELPVMPKIVEPYSHGTISQDAQPVVQVAPQYPMVAAREGKEGYVIVEFDISAVGSVTNVSVIEANPKRVFNRSAVRAIKGWKYKPKVVEGNPVVQIKQQVRLDFTLDNTP